MINFWGCLDDNTLPRWHSHFQRCSHHHVRSLLSDKLYFPITFTTLQPTFVSSYHRSASFKDAPFEPICLVLRRWNLCSDLINIGVCGGQGKVLSAPQLDATTTTDEPFCYLPTRSASDIWALMIDEPVDAKALGTGVVPNCKTAQM
jgi:hypothetical protein